MTPIKIKQTHPNATFPTLGSEHAAAFDCFAVNDDDITILPGETKRVPLGFALEIPEFMVALLFARSGLGCTQGLRPGNCVGVIDSDYRGEVQVCLHNDANEWRVIRKGDKVCQVMFLNLPPVEFEQADELSETGRGIGGFGSTGE